MASPAPIVDVRGGKGGCFRMVESPILRHRRQNRRRMFRGRSVSCTIILVQLVDPFLVSGISAGDLAEDGSITARGILSVLYSIMILELV